MSDSHVEPEFFDESDQFRSLRVDTIPDEVPIFWDNGCLQRQAVTIARPTVGAKCQCKRCGKCFEFAAIRIVQWSVWADSCKAAREFRSSPSVPFQFESQQGLRKIRRLSLPHPSAQLEVARLLHKYSCEIFFACRRSEASLRSPTAFHGKMARKESAQPSEDPPLRAEVDIAAGADVARTGLETREYVFRTFKYRSEDRLWRWIEGRKFSQLENRFEYLLRFDIESCFDSVYTHSIEWAALGREVAKERHKSRSDLGHFAARFDQCVRNSNDGETHGILIGPESSRIFFEVIASRIDSVVLNKLRDRNSDRNGEGSNDADFAVRRYVDDYFIFANRESAAKEILELYRAELKHWRFHINPSKIQQFRRPFVLVDVNVASIAEALREHLFRLRSVFGGPGGIADDTERLRRDLHAWQKTAQHLTRQALRISADATGAHSPVRVVSILKGGVEELLRRLDSDGAENPTYDPTIHCCVQLIDLIVFACRVAPLDQSVRYFCVVVVQFMRVISARSQGGYDRTFAKVGSDAALEVASLYLGFLKDLSDGCDRQNGRDADDLRICNLVCCLIEFPDFCRPLFDDVMALLGFANRAGEESAEFPVRNIGRHLFSVFAIYWYACASAEDVSTQRFNQLHEIVFRECAKLIRKDGELQRRAESWFLVFGMISCPQFPFRNRASLCRQLLSLWREKDELRRIGRDALVRYGREVARRLEATPLCVNWAEKLDLLNRLRRQIAAETY